LSRGLAQDDLRCDDLIRHVWIDSENVRQHPRRWRKIWELATLPEAERFALTTMPDEMPIFRGARTANGAKGLSWSLDCATARKFATRFSESGFLISGLVAKADIKAYLGERNENEVIVLPERVRILEINASHP